MSELAVLGGGPAFPDGIPLVRPPLPALERVVARFEKSYENGRLTNGPLVDELEAAAAAKLGVRHVVAVSSCTAGLMLALRALDPDGPVVLPSFTFSASGHVVRWNGLRPVFAECDSASLQLDVGDARARVATEDGLGAVLATHVFGAPCPVDDVVAFGAERGVPVVFDAAHAFGALHGDVPIGGFGDAEVFSMSPSKVMIAAEGGLVATNRDDVADSIRIGRDYGNPGDYDTRFVGLNARLSELHAAVALESLSELDEHLETRTKLARRYVDALADVPGVAPQAVADGDRSTYKDFTIVVDPDVFGVTRDQLVTVLRAEGVDTRCYFDPPVHRQTAYADLEPVSLPVTDRVAGRVVSIPLFRSLPESVVDRIGELLAAVHARHAKVAAALPA